MGAVLLGALKLAPTIFAAGKSIVEAVTGAPVPDEAAKTPEALAGYVGTLPEGQQAEILEKTIAAKVRYQELDTKRFVAMTDGDAEKVRATARPEIAKQAMAVIATFAQVFRILIFAVIAEWAIRSIATWIGHPLPATDSLPNLLAEMQPVSEMIWAPLIASFWVCAEIIRKYFGCRERDKAIQYEMQHGQPLTSTQATIEAAGGTIASVVKAFRGK